MQYFALTISLEYFDKMCIEFNFANELKMHYSHNDEFNSYFDRNVIKIHNLFTLATSKVKFYKLLNLIFSFIYIYY